MVGFLFNMVFNAATTFCFLFLISTSALDHNSLEDLLHKESDNSHKPQLRKLRGNVVNAGKVAKQTIFNVDNGPGGIIKPIIPAPSPPAPGTSIPSTSTSSVSTPGTSIPSTSTPGTSIPSTSTPGTSIPSTSTPGTSIPSTPTPGVSISSTSTSITSTTSTTTPSIPTNTNTTVKVKPTIPIHGKKRHMKIKIKDIP